MQLNHNFDAELQAITKTMGMDLAMISHIREQDYEVVAVCGELPFFSAGDHLETADTFCRTVVQKDEVVTYVNVSAQSQLIMHPAYQLIPVETYIGLPLHHQGRVVGTLHFSSLDQHPEVNERNNMDRLYQLASQIENAILAA